MKKQILTITLNPALDKFKDVQRKPKGNHDLPNEHISAGGKGLNVSRALMCLGDKTLATGIVAGATGKLIITMLKREGIPSHFLNIRGETRTNITFSQPSSNNAKRVIGQGPMADKGVLDRFEAMLKGLLQGSSVVVISGKSANGAPENYYARLIDMCRACNITTALDTSSVDLRETLKAKPDIIKPNLEEAEFVLGRKLATFNKLKKAVKEFHQLGIRMPLLTLAERGALGCFRGQLWHCRVPKIREAHGVGCGDAFLAGFLSARLRRYNFPDALRFAASCGTINCRGKVPGKIDKGEVQALLKSVSVKEV